MRQEYKIKISMIQILFSVLICIIFIVMKFIFREEDMITELYNYLISDIVFRH